MQNANCYFVLQQKLSSGDEFGLPRKRAKLSHAGQELEDLECEPATCQSTKGADTKSTSPLSTFQKHDITLSMFFCSLG